MSTCTSEVCQRLALADPSHELAVDRSAFISTQVFLLFLSVRCRIHLLTLLTQQNITMSSALDKMVPIFTGSNWQQWHTSMQAYLWAQGQWFVYSTTQPADGHDNRKDWDDNTERALGNITLPLAPSIQVAVSELAMVKEVWDHLKKNFGAPSIGSAYAELSWLLATHIPTGSHPAPAITKLLSHFTYLKDTSFKFPAPVQAMIILCKLPPTMEVVAQI